MNKDNNESNVNMYSFINKTFFIKNKLCSVLPIADINPVTKYFIYLI